MAARALWIDRLHDAKKGHLGVLELLLRIEGIEVNRGSEPRGVTPLIAAAEMDHVGCVARLLAAPGIEVNKARKDGGATWTSWLGDQRMIDAAEADAQFHASPQVLCVDPEAQSAEMLGPELEGEGKYFGGGNYFGRKYLILWQIFRWWEKLLNLLFLQFNKQLPDNNISTM